MPSLFGRSYTRAELLERLGDIDQVAGVTRLTYAEGPERGVEVLRFRTGSGLDFDVLPGRGMDLAHAAYQGRPLAWISAQGVPHAAHFEPEGLGWLRSFFGGLVTTCGLLNAGNPGPDPGHTASPAGIGTEDGEGIKVGLHGRVNNTPARSVAADGHWDGDDYLLTAYGKVREAIVFGENVELTRRILAVAGESSIQLHDEVTNRGYETMPHMMLYHMNLGFPVVDERSELVVSGTEVVARDEAAAPYVADCRRFAPPQREWPEQVFYHTATPDGDGFCQAGIVNRGLDDGFGVGITWRADTLPELVQWKYLKRGGYVCGLEPANCRVGGRAAEREAGRLKVIEPGQTISYDLMVTVLDGAQACAAFEAAARR